MLERHSRQSFLGAEAPNIICNTTIGIVGLGGGGSHVAQQLAHVGFMNYVTADPDYVEESNLNRMVGATHQDALGAVKKVDVLKRLIQGINPEAEVTALPARWEDSRDALKKCDIAFGCLDSMTARRDFEAFTRRHLIPYVDIGLDVHQVGDQAPEMAGQVVVSMPGEPCMRCLGFLTDANLAAAAARYGDAGIRPQVVWANGVLASTAVGIGMDLLTGWTRLARPSLYLSYDANRNRLVEHVRASFARNKACPHYPSESAGAAIFLRL